MPKSKHRKGRGKHRFKYGPGKLVLKKTVVTKRINPMKIKAERMAQTAERAERMQEIAQKITSHEKTYAERMKELQERRAKIEAKKEEFRNQNN